MTKKTSITQNKRFKYAGFAKRLFAYNIDMTILMIPCVLMSFLIENNKVLYVVCILIVCLYHAVMESSEYQATIGKKYSKIRVVNNDKERLDFPKAFLRIILKFFSLLLLFSGFIFIIFRKDRRGLHDIIINTLVIIDDNTDQTEILSC